MFSFEKKREINVIVPELEKITTMLVSLMMPENLLVRSSIAALRSSAEAQRVLQPLKMILGRFGPVSCIRLGC